MYIPCEPFPSVGGVPEGGVGFFYGNPLIRSQSIHLKSIILKFVNWLIWDWLIRLWVYAYTHHIIENALQHRLNTQLPTEY